MKKSNKNNLKIQKLFFLVFLSLTTFYNLSAQEDDTLSIEDAYKEYAFAFREVAYCHLSKSIFIKGEQLGFASYVINKDSKTPSQLTKNLYCVIADSSDNVIKSKLIKVNNGFSSNVFDLDSLFTSGKYTFKAYTNWMNNFDEKNAYFETFRVIDPQVEKAIKQKPLENIIDVQFLPEGGHFVDSVKTNVGVVIKNQKGFGIPYTVGDVFDKNKKFITSFKTNSLGFSKFLLYPFKNQQYTVKINHLNKEFEFSIDGAEDLGITLHLNEIKGKLILDFKSNNRTINEIKDKPYQLAIHNGKKIRIIDIEFDTTDLIKVIDLNELTPGINIFTLFNENKKPILERVFFNYNGMNTINLEKPSFSKWKDSLKIRIPFHDDLHSFSNNDIHNISISVLPEGTKSYQKHHNIISYTYLQPYVRGFVENAAYYFTNINNKKKYDLDNLLITQGWSSYNWDNIFKKQYFPYNFEEGINIIANVNGDNQKEFLVYPLKNNASEIFTLKESEKAFKQKNLFPEEDETYKVGLLKANDRMKKPSLYLQFYPSKRPTLKLDSYTIPYNNENVLKQNNEFPIRNAYFIKTKDVEQLDEILIEVNKNATRIEALKNKSYGNIDFFDDKKRRPGLTLASYLSGRGFYANDSNGILSILNPNPTSPNNNVPLIILDGVFINDFGFLANFSMQTVDYIEINKSGIGYGLRGGGGVIKIVTDPTLASQNSGYSNANGEYKFPLSFSTNKKFYIPKYEVYNNDFFKEYGVIDWIPDGKIDSEGNLNFTIYNPANNNLKLFIEGVNQQGEFISDIKSLSITN